MAGMLSRLALVAALALGLAGCFQPLHGGALSQSPETLSRIEVMPIDGHLGHQVKSELEFILNNGKPPEKPLYRLTVRPRGTNTNVIVDSAQGRPQVMSYALSANYQLVSIADGASVAAGTVTSTASYDRSQQRFATVRALRDAEIRTARILAEQLKASLMQGLFGPKT